MKKKFKELEQNQLLKKFDGFSSFPPKYNRPSEGWIRTLRKALGMTTVQLSKRLNVKQSRISEIEKAEINDQLTLSTLRKVAQSLNCRLEYVLIPEKPLDTILKKRAEMIARQKVDYISRHMELEDQALSAEEKERQITSLANELLKTPRKLWED